MTTSSAPKYVAGVDSSTQSCKVVIVDPETGSVVREGRASHPDGTEVDPNAWWDAFLEALDDAGGLDDVAALSVSGQQHGMVCLDANGEVIRPALLWNDTRSGDAAEQLVLDLGDGDRELGAQRWIDLTGSIPVASITVTKLRWLADNEPENAEKIAAICLPHDWLTWKIAGSPGLEALVTDRSDASGTGYMSRLEPEYLPSLLALGLRREDVSGVVLPKILDPWAEAGRGDSDRGWGHVVLGPGTGDNAGAALGVGLVAGQSLLSLGTSGVVSVVSDSSVADPAGAVNGFADATGHWLALAVTLNASRILDAVARIIDADYAELDELALSVPDAGGLVLQPYFGGERTPNLPDATATLSGMTMENSDRAHVARAGVEGLLELMRFALDAVRNLGVPIDTVYLVGGGAKSKAVQELAAQFLDAKVEVPPAAEYVALGAAEQARRVLENASK